MAGNKGIVPNKFYRFSAANRTITFTSDYSGLDLGEITYITNIKDGVATVIYDPFDASKGGRLDGLTLTLSYDTTLMADTDPLQVITGFTPLNADPTPVKVVPDVNDSTQTELLQNISDNLDFLNLSLDSAEGIEINVREKNPVTLKRDTENALVMSDAVDALVLNFSPSSTITTPAIDTRGYQTVVWMMPNISSFNVSSVQFSPDGVNWGGSFFYYFGGSGWTATSTLGTGGANILMAAPVFHRYFRVTVTNSSSTRSTITFTLRRMSFPYLGVTDSVGRTSANITLINSTAPTANSTTPTDPTTTSTTSGGIPISGHLRPTSNPPNAATSLQTTVPFPLGIGGREQPYVGALSGIFRYITVDANGRYILGGDNAFSTPYNGQIHPSIGGAKEIAAANTARGVGSIPNTIQGSQALLVEDVSQEEGDTNSMLLKQVLTELKILNQNFAELPQMLNLPAYTLSDPQEYRDDCNFS